MRKVIGLLTGTALLASAALMAGCSGKKSEEPRERHPAPFYLA